MRKVLVIAAVMLVSNLAIGQNKSAKSETYNNAIGLRAFDGGGITFKHFFNEKNAGELIGYFWKQGIRISGLYEIHGNLTGDNFKWYVGPALHLGLYNSKYGDASSVGIGGVLGLDYKFKDAPINMSLDWQPTFEVSDSRGFAGGWGGLAIRYTF